LQAKESSDAEAAIEEDVTRSAAVETDLSALTAGRAKQVSEVSENEAQLRMVRDELNELHEQRAAQQVRESQLQMKIDNLAERIDQRYHIDLRRFDRDEAAFDKILRVQ